MSENPTPAPQPSPQKPRQKRRDDFHLGKILGRGAFGQVIDVEDKENGRHYAMKVLSKVHIMREQKMAYVKVERDVMTRLRHPNIIKLLLTFQDPGNLYYVVELAPRGDLQAVLNTKYSIDVPQSRLLLGQVLLALAHMHQKRIVHRDIKPENILLDEHNNVKITDFGTAKIFAEDTPFRCSHGSFVGSADYVSPETLNETALCPSTDLWSYGCLIYALLVGYPPFHSDSNYATFQKIEANEYTIPDFVPEDAADLIRKILVLDPDARLGNEQYASNYEPIRNHPFFNGLNWDELPKQGIPDFTPFQPAIDARNTEEAKKNSTTLIPPEEGIIRESHVTYHKPTGDKELCLVLTDKPRFFLSDVNKTKLKAEIPITSELTLTNTDPNTLLIKIDKVNEPISLGIDPSEIDGWAQAIREAIENV